MRRRTAVRTGLAEGPNDQVRRRLLASSWRSVEYLWIKRLELVNIRPAMNTEFSIGSVNVRPATVLAPMEGITDRPFRRMIRTLGGCGLTVTEFVSSDQLTKQSRRAWKMTEFDDNEHPVSIQIYGRDPKGWRTPRELARTWGPISST